MLSKLLAGASLCRYGDGEFAIAFTENDRDNQYQKPSLRLTERLAEILLSSKNDDSLLVAIPPIDNLKTSTDVIQVNGVPYWEYFWVKSWNELKQYLIRSEYANSFFSRDQVFDYLAVEDICKIWKERKVVFVYSTNGRFLINHKVFDSIIERKEVLVPATHAFSEYDRILDECKTFSKEYMFLISAGPTATILAYDLHKLGYQAIDIGHFPNCYNHYFENGLLPEFIPRDKSKIKQKNILSRLAKVIRNYIRTLRNKPIDRY